MMSCEKNVYDLTAKMGFSFGELARSDMMTWIFQDKSDKMTV